MNHADPAREDAESRDPRHAGNWRDFLEHVPAGMVRVRPDGSLAWLNSHAAGLFGFASPQAALAALQGTGICLESGRTALAGDGQPSFPGTSLTPKAECSGLDGSAFPETGPQAPAPQLPAGPPWPAPDSESLTDPGASPMLTFEAWCHRQDADTWLARFRLRRVADGDGDTLHFEGVVDDITAPRRAREAKATSEARYRLERQRLRTVLDAIPGPVWTVRQDMTLASTNAVYDEMTSQTRGCFCHGRANTGQLHCGKCPTRTVLDTGLPAARECTFPDGRVFLINAVPFRDEDGTPLALGLAVNITAQKNLERELTEAREQALAATEAKSRFLASMSHEIRTPLNGVLGNLQLLLEGFLDASQEESVRAALGSGRLLMRLIDDILDLSKIESGTLEFTSEPVDLPHLLSQVTGLLGALADAKGLALECSAPRVQIMGDPARITQIMLNLAGNAVKYTSKGFVRVALSLEQPLAAPLQSILAITVEDSGPGIPENKRQAVFEPFTQLGAPVRTTFGGVGLGLNIVSRLVRAMDGELDLHDRSGGGTTVTVRLPVTVRPFAQDATDESRPRPARPLRVLVVEDERVNQRMLVRALERRGHAAALAGDGLEALEILRAGSFDLVLMDIQMPRMDGLEATRAIRQGVAGEAASAVPVVSLTAHAMSGDKERCLEAGVNHHLTKPVELSELDRVLARVAQGAPPR